MRSLTYGKEIEPSEYQPADAVPECKREGHKEKRVGHMLPAEPPVRQPENGNQSDSREREEYGAVTERHPRGLAMPPGRSRAGSQKRSTFRTAADANRYMNDTLPPLVE